MLPNSFALHAAALPGRPQRKTSLGARSNAQAPSLDAHARVTLITGLAPLATPQMRSGGNLRSLKLLLLDLLDHLKLDADAHLVADQHAASLESYVLAVCRREI